MTRGPLVSPVSVYKKAIEQVIARRLGGGLRKTHRWYVELDIAGQDKVAVLAISDLAAAALLANGVHRGGDR